MYGSFLSQVLRIRILSIVFQRLTRRRLIFCLGIFVLYFCTFALQTIILVLIYYWQSEISLHIQAPVDMAHNLSHINSAPPRISKGSHALAVTTTGTTMPPAFPPPPYLYEQHGNRGERKSNKQGQEQKTVVMATVADYQQVRSFSTVRILYWSD